MNLGYPAVAGPVLAAASSACVAGPTSIAIACNRPLSGVEYAIRRVVASVAVQRAKDALRLPRTAADAAPAHDKVAIEPRTGAVHAPGGRCTLALAATPGHWPVARRVDACESLLQNEQATQPVLDP